MREVKRKKKERRKERKKEKKERKKERKEGRKERKKEREKEREKERKEETKKNMQGRAWGHLGFLWSHHRPRLPAPCSSSAQSSNNPLLSPPEEKLKAFFWKKSSLLRPLLFTFGRTAIGGEFKHRKRPLGYRKSCRHVWKTCHDAAEMHLPRHAQPQDDTGSLPPHQATRLQLFLELRLFLPSLRDIDPKAQRR